jgi:hypothetical protein
MVRLWCAPCPPVWTTKNPRGADLGVSHGAGDENRTRALRLGSDDAWVGSIALTGTDGSCEQSSYGSGRTAVDRGRPLLRARCGHGHAEPPAERVHARALRLAWPVGMSSLGVPSRVHTSSGAVRSCCGHPHPQHPSDPCPGGDGTMTEEHRTFRAPLTMLTPTAAVTKRARLGTSTPKPCGARRSQATGPCGMAVTGAVSETARCPTGWVGLRIRTRRYATWGPTMSADDKGRVGPCRRCCPATTRSPGSSSCPAAPDRYRSLRSHS